MNSHTEEAMTSQDMLRRSLPIYSRTPNPTTEERIDALANVRRFLKLDGCEIEVAHELAERHRIEPAVIHSNGDEARPATMTLRELVTDEGDVRICDFCGETIGTPHKICCPAYTSRGGFLGMYDSLD
jgi:hypothetical protein